MNTARARVPRNGFSWPKVPVPLGMAVFESTRARCSRRAPPRQTPIGSRRGRAPPRQEARRRPPAGREQGRNDPRLSRLADCHCYCLEYKRGAFAGTILQRLYFSTALACAKGGRVYWPDEQGPTYGHTHEPRIGAAVSTVFLSIPDVGAALPAQVATYLKKSQGKFVLQRYELATVALSRAGAVRAPGRPRQRLSQVT